MISKMKSALIFLGLLSVSFADFCPNATDIPKTCVCDHFGPGGDEEVGQTIFSCTEIDQPTFEKLVKDLAGYKFDEFEFIECKFNKLHDRAFENITIGLLDIENTPISTVEREAFAGIPHLKEISLLNTSITKIPHFKHISHSLVEMLISENDIRRLDKDEFVDLVNLNVVILDLNNIQEIEDGVFHGLDNLQEVNLEGNNITKVGNWFPVNSSLEILNLSDNFIFQLPVTFFPALPALVELNLNDNNFEDLPEKIFKDYVEYKKDVEILIYNNQLVCDTRLCWLYKYLDSVEYIDVQGRCEEPGEFSGRKLEDISQLDVYCK